MNISIHWRNGLFETLFIETHIIPLARRILVFGIEKAINQVYCMVKAALDRVVGNAQIRNCMAAVGVVTGQIPYDRATPVMSHPDGFLSAEGVQQVKHVAHNEFLRVVVVVFIDRRTSVAAHVRRDYAETQSAKHGKLMPPTS